MTAICALLDEMLPDSPHRPHAALIASVADRPAHDKRYAMDAGRIRRELGWAPRESFETGLRKTVPGISAIAGGGSRSGTAAIPGTARLRYLVAPAKAGDRAPLRHLPWIPAFAGTTKKLIRTPGRT